jgi:cytochrome c peroxidase
MRFGIPTSALFSLALALSPVFAAAGEVLTAEQSLGKLLFQDKNLSLNRNQACVSCHGLAPAAVTALPASVSAAGFVDLTNVRTGTAVSTGSILTRKGTLNAPSVGYAAFSPLFHCDSTERLYVGGQFWNARAKNLAEQAAGPFLNPAEMAMPNQWAVVSRLKEIAQYVSSFMSVYRFSLASVPALPAGSLSGSAVPASVPMAYQLMARAISTYEQSGAFNKFNSKFDYVLAGKTVFTPLEIKGLALFNDPEKGNCAACHVSKAGRGDNGKIIPPLFTDFTYDNIGLPRNEKIPNNPIPNLGLGGRPDIAKVDPGGLEIGKHKVMALRNIAITPPYGHNGVFATLEQVVHFYNTRDTLGRVPNSLHPGFGITGWPAPEVAKNVNARELGNLGLTPTEETAIVAFLKTLTDDYPSWGKDPRVPPGSPVPSVLQIKVPKF